MQSLSETTKLTIVGECLVNQLYVPKLPLKSDLLIKAYHKVALVPSA